MGSTLRQTAPKPLDPLSNGSGSSLPQPLLIVSLACTIFATIVSLWSIFLHLKGYRRPNLQRLVVRIMIMIPLYAIASLVSLHSLEAAFWIDAVRDLYEAFVIYTFFTLLIAYLGGERSLLILLHGRPPTRHVFPVSIFVAEMDGSDPYTFLGLKRGILQYVYVKPILAIATLILKSTSTYGEGDFALNTGYTYVSIVYNISITLSLYCLAMLWVTIHHDVKPFRPTPKFLCVKGILFFSFWQSIAISLLVAWKVIKKLGPYTDPEHMSLALNDVMLCLEMPLFAIAHQFAFCRLDDYVDPSLQYVARMPFTLALRDAAGLRDVITDFKATFLGRGMSYRSFEPVEGGVHVQGKARERRIRAGLRYEGGVKGGKKYWLPVPHGDGGVLGGIGRDYGTMAHSVPTVGVMAKNGHGPHSIGHLSPPLHPSSNASANYFATPFNRRDDYSDDESTASLSFSSIPTSPVSGTSPLPDNDERLYEEARGFLHGDWGYRVVDVSKEQAVRRMREEEESVLRGYGRSGRGRMRGERWGRGRLGAGTGPGPTEEPRRVYGAWGGNGDSATFEPSEPISPGKTNLTFVIEDDDKRVDDSQATNSLIDLATHGFHEWADKGKEAAHQLSSGLRDVGHHLVPATSLEFSNPNSRRSSFNESERPEMPSDAVDLVVEAPGKVDLLDHEPGLVQQYSPLAQTRTLDDMGSRWYDEGSSSSNPWD